MRLGVTLFCLIAVATSTLLKSDRSLASDAQGELVLLEIKSSVFGNTRKLRVWLPDDYHSQDNKSNDWGFVNFSVCRQKNLWAVYPDHIHLLPE